MNKYMFVFFAVVCGMVVGSLQVAAAAAGPEASFDASYEKYASVAETLKEDVETDSATLSDQKAYFDAVIKLFLTQNQLMFADLSGKEQTEAIQMVILKLQSDIKDLQEISDLLATVSNEEGMITVVEKIAAYVDSYTSDVRQPVLLVYADRFIKDVIQPAQDRYTAMKDIIDTAKQNGKDVGSYETALRDVRLKLYEAKGFLDDVVRMLSGKTYSLDAIEKDMQQAQEIIKTVYVTYKDLSLKSGSLFTQ